MKQFGAYLIAAAALSVLLSLITSFLRESSAKKTVLLLCGAVLTVALLKPILSVRADWIAEAISSVEFRKIEAETEISTRNTEILKSIICEKAEAYILDKAKELGAAVTVHVEAETGKYYPYPAYAEISGTLSAEDRIALTRYMEATLGIPAERQTYLP